jgi:SecD/SecF fusion protein
MQLKGLVRFFTILLIVYSIYQLSFTWFVRSHEKKLESRAKTFVRVNYPNASAELTDSVYKRKLKDYEDSTKDETITYGITGAISYQKAKNEELNLGLDLQGGMNVTLEVEMTGLLKTLSNNSKDPNFLRALDNANRRKANSGENFIRLFAEEYKKLVPGGNLASLFAASNSGIKVNDSDSKVMDVLETLSKDAFDNTYRVMRTRIDQFGVAQPNINPDASRGIITVELPGVTDEGRVRNYLQSSANLQFWEVYQLPEIGAEFQKADDVFFKLMGGKSAKGDTAAKGDTNIVKDSGSVKDTSGNLAKFTNDSNKKADTTIASQENQQEEARKHLYGWLIPGQGYKDNNGKEHYSPYIGKVRTSDTATLNSMLRSPAISSIFPAQLTWMYGKPEVNNQTNKTSEYLDLYAIKTFGRDKAKIEGEAVSNSRMDYNQQGQPEVMMDMNAPGTKAWAKMTGENVGRPIAIVLDNIVYSAPNVNGPIDGGTSSISGGFTVQEATDLARILNAGKYPAPAKIVQEQTVGPTLGKEAINGGIMAFGISFLVIFILMLVYYNTSGVVANIALILNLLFTIGILAGLGATLTAPGIAGLVLTIGMAVDTNVIIYERIKEELDRGKGYIPAINEGYKRSLPPVLDAHVTTLLTAIILFYFGLGPVKGFATTQILGILLSLFCGILVSRWVSDIFTNKKRHLEYFTKTSRKIFKHAKFKFIEYRKIAYGISVVVLLAGIGAYFNGFDEGVEFKGGRSYTVAFEKPAPVEQIRKSLETAFPGESPVMKTVGNSRTLDITTAYLIDSTGSNVDSVVEGALTSNLQKFGNSKIIGFKKVLPTISDDLKAGAIKATIFALLVIFLYIFIRFRDWRYSFGTIVALLHDVLVTLAVFSFARKIVNFPLEIDQHFIAAILTVIGFSMNDTVIVFDRIREDRRLYPTAPLGDTINRAINETLSRTIMTSLTVFLTILILFLVGGEVTKGFAFAMLIGVITGTYSSVFVAAPILVDLVSKKSKKPAVPAAGKVDIKQKPQSV